MYVQALVDNLNKRFLDLYVFYKSKVLSPKYDPSNEEVCITNHCIRHGNFVDSLDALMRVSLCKIELIKGNILIMAKHKELESS
jgi:hypothetical protein